MCARQLSLREDGDDGDLSKQGPEEHKRLQSRRAGSAAGAEKASTYPPHRIGGAYCNPPFDQMLLIPRGTPIGVMLRSQTSPKLPTCLITL